MAPCIVCLALFDIREDIVRCDQHAVALETDVEGQIGYGRYTVAAVGVV
jgi:hypothetical protein